MSLATAWEQLDAEAFIESIRASAQAVFCTRNFFYTIETDGKRGEQDEYLRPVDWALAFANGDMLLLSEREANGVLLARAWSNNRFGRTTLTPPTLIHLSYAGSLQRGPALAAPASAIFYGTAGHESVQHCPTFRHQEESPGSMNQLSTPTSSCVMSCGTAEHKSAQH